MTDDPMTGYSGWRWLEMSAGELLKAHSLCKAFNRCVAMEGGPAAELTIRKASLTISTTEAHSGAGHTLAGGQPFYHCRITTHDQAQGVHLALMLAQALGQHGGAALLTGDTTEVRFDRRSLNDVAPLPATAGHAARMLKVR